MKVLVKICQEDIDKGDHPAKLPGTFDPIERRLKIMGFENPCRHWEYIVYGGNPGINSVYVKTPRSVKRFARRLTLKGKEAVKPFNFYLDTDIKPFRRVV
jgi:hypothetical protein